jgi:L-arabinokinase
VGIASSATVEVSVLHGLDQLLGLGLEGVDLGRLGQMAENRVVGAPCGIMDQLAVACGSAGRLLHILCQPDIVCGEVETPESVEFAGVNSHVKHSVGGAKYTETRVATFMGRKIIFDRLRRAGGLDRGEVLFGGYLCNIEAQDYAALYRRWLPRRMTGAAFLKKHGTTEDPVAPVDPDKTYCVESRASHPIFETARVRAFISRLYNARLTGDPRFLVQAGELMYASHWSYARRCGQSCREIDFLVSLARRMGAARGIYGAKITGGGSGGVVAVMGDKARLSAALAEIVGRYEREFGIRGQVFMGSSPGARQFRRLKIQVQRVERV